MSPSVAKLADFSIMAFVAATIVSSCPPVVNISVSSISRTNKLEAKTNKAKIQMCLLLKGPRHENFGSEFLTLYLSLSGWATDELEEKYNFVTFDALTFEIFSEKPY
jgi:hypothetical protein